MIIRFPTGLYRSIFPEGSESGNITYTVSSDSPPRPIIKANQLPNFEISQLAPEKVFDDETRRTQFGELVFTIANSSRSDPGSNKKLFEVGQVLDFEENPPETEIQQLGSPEQIDIQHNTNLFDFESIGLDSSEVEQLVRDSQNKQKELEEMFLSLQTEIKNLDAEISENQKRINETTKTIRAVRDIYGISEGDLTFSEGTGGEIYQKLLVNLTELESNREQLISDRNNRATQADEIFRSVVKVSELIR